MARPGPLRDFVRKHIGLSNAEIADKAAAAGLPLDARKVASHRYHVLRANQPKRKGSKRKGVKRGPYKKRQSTKAKPERMSDKEAALRKLVFELGFDIVQKVYEEFAALHRDMR